MAGSLAAGGGGGLARRPATGGGSRSASAGSSNRAGAGSAGGRPFLDQRGPLDDRKAAALTALASRTAARACPDRRPNPGRSREGRRCRRLPAPLRPVRPRPLRRARRPPRSAGRRPGRRGRSVCRPHRSSTCRCHSSVRCRASGRLRLGVPVGRRRCVRGAKAAPYLSIVLGLPGRSNPFRENGTVCPGNRPHGRRIRRDRCRRHGPATSPSGRTGAFVGGAGRR